MANLWLNIKRGKSYIDIYHKGEKICTIKVSEQNRGNSAILLLDSGNDTRFKVEKEAIINNDDESRFNSEEYNK